MGTGHGAMAGQGRESGALYQNTYVYRADETTDALRNTIRIRRPKKELSGKEKKQKARANKARKARGEAISSKQG